MDRQKGLLGSLFEKTNRRRFYPKGSFIILQSSAVDEVYLITNGLVRIYSIDSSGNQHTVAFFSENHIMPVSWLLSSPPTEGATFFYQAATDTSCYSVFYDDVRQFMQANTEICIMLLDTLTKQYINSASRIQTLQRSNASEKIDFIIYYIATLCGRSPGNNGIREVTAPITHQEIADLAGLTRESVSRQMSKPKYKKILYVDKNITYFDLSKLNLQAMPKVYPLNM
jgi:CRP/FNR family cyclic AMP-dependent transcriptional regulator